MTIPAAIRTRLLADAGVTAITTTIRPLVRQEGDTLPMVRYDKINSRPLRSLTGSSGVKKVRYQFVAVAKDFTTADALRKAVYDALVGGVGLWGSLVIQSCEPVNQELDYFDPETQEFCSQVDLYIWVEEA